MARLQDFQSVTPSGSDKLLIVQPQGQGLATLDNVAAALSKRNSYIYTFNYLSTPYSLTSTSYTDVFTGITQNIQAGTYYYTLTIGAKWTLPSAFFNGEVKFDTDNAVPAVNVYAEPIDGLIVFYGRVVLSTSGSHTIQPAFKVTDANKTVTIKQFTTPVIMLTRE